MVEKIMIMLMMLMFKNIIVALIAAYGYYVISHNVWYKNASFFEKIDIKPRIITAMIFLIFFKAIIDIAMHYILPRAVLSPNKTLFFFYVYVYAGIFPFIGFLYFWYVLKVKNSNYAPNKLAMVAFLSLLPNILYFAIQYLLVLLFSALM